MSDASANAEDEFVAQYEHDYAARRVAREVYRAMHPAGMSTYDGKVCLESSHVARLLTRWKATPPAPAEAAIAGTYKDVFHSLARLACYAHSHEDWPAAHEHEDKIKEYLATQQSTIAALIAECEEYHARLVSILDSGALKVCNCGEPDCASTKLRALVARRDLSASSEGKGEAT